MANKTTTFKGTGGTGGSLWSDPTLWSLGVPVDGDSVLRGGGVDDIASLSLDSLTTAGSESVPTLLDVYGALAIGTLYSFGDDAVVAAATAAGTQATVTVGAIVDKYPALGYVGPIADLIAGGGGALVVDQSTTDPGTNFTVQEGGTIEITSAAVADHSLLFYNTGGGTFALGNPGATSAAFINPSPGDVLELPGTTVQAVSFGAKSLSITTDQGTYAFSNVSYEAPIAGYTAAVDPKTGLVAITFDSADVFERNVKATTGPYTGNYLWSNAANWSNGVPVDGDSVVVDVKGGGTGAPLDDLTSLHLAELTLLDEAGIAISGTSLTVDTLVASSDANGLVLDAAEAGHPVTVTVGTLDSTGVDYDAFGAGARLINQSATDQGNIFDTPNGGVVDIAAPPSADSELYWGEDGVLAFRDPAAVNHVALENLGPGSVLELPGSSVLALTIGVESLSIVTDAGSYAFDHVGPNDFDIRDLGYTAAKDPTTGLVAITFTGDNVFRTVERASSGLFTASYLWSDAANWSVSVPADGGTVKVDPGSGATAVDDLGSLTLATLRLGGNGHVSVPTGSLTVSTVQAESGGSLLAGVASGTVGAITVDAITGAGGIFGADGAGSRFVDDGTTDPAATYQAAEGGFTELRAAPADASTLRYLSGTGTFALDDPAASMAAALNGVAPGDVLELPGTAVSAVALGATSLGVTTDAGTYAFTNVSYAAPVAGYTANRDAKTGLLALTFTGPDVFEQNVQATSGPFAGAYLWSNIANWSAGLPVDGGAVATSVTGFDDIASLDLATLRLGASGVVFVPAESLKVQTVSVTAGSALVAGSSVTATPATVTVGAIDGTGAIVDAEGPQATLLVQSATDPGEQHSAIDGGLVELSATPSSASVLRYIEGSGRIALRSPATSDAVWLRDVEQGDTLELPGTAVSAVTFGAHSLNVTTDAGSYAFTNVTYVAPLTGYAAERDATTGLLALTFTGEDVFEKNFAATSGPLAGKYLWSNAANWSAGVPVNGASVSVADQTTEAADDLAALSLSSLSLNGSDLYVTGASLNVGTATGGGHLSPGGTSYYGTLTADASDAEAPVTVTVGAIADTSIYGDTFLASGIGATFVDQSATDLGEKYNALRGGILKLGASPKAASVLTYNATIVGDAVQGASTFALNVPAGSVAAELSNIEPGDVLELPGAAVSGATFGADNLSVTTTAGTYAFSNVRYGQPVDGYTAALDPATGLVALTFTGPDVFEQTVKATSGPYAGYYLWSNPANWSQGVPLNGGSVSVASDENFGVDDLGTLALARFDLNENSQLFVVGTRLGVAAMSVAGGASLVSGDLTANAVTVTLGSVQGANGFQFADGTAGRIVNQSATDPGGYYHTTQGGVDELAAPPAATSTLVYSGGTFALHALGSITAAALSNVAPGDVLELPGTAISAASFGASSLSVTTDAGIYAFTNVAYAGTVDGYTAAKDPATGLVALTFTGPDVFEANVKAASGKFAGDYLWSDPANWSLGRGPVDGDDVVIADQTTTSYDDLPSLNLINLTLNHSDVDVVGQSLAVANVIGGVSVGAPTFFGFLTADAITAGAPVTVTVGSISGTRSSYAAYGAGALFTDRSIDDDGNTYAAGTGGTFVLDGTPAGNSDFWYSDSGNIPGTIAIAHPAPSTTSDIDYFGAGDVLELPGTSVSAFTFSAGHLSVTTDAGAYSFVAYYAVDGYTAAKDPATGLVAITFTGPDVFKPNVKDGDGFYRYSDTANWSQGLPLPGDGVLVSNVPDGLVLDDLPGLTLSALTIDGSAGMIVGGGQLTVDGPLTIGDVGVGRLIISGGAEVTAASVALGGEGTIVLDGGTLDPPIPVTIDAGGTMTGAGTIDGAVTLQGTLEASGGVLAVDGAVTGTGTLAIGAGATLDLEQGAALAQGGSIRFDGEHGTLRVGAGQSIAGTLTGFDGSDTLDFDGQTIDASTSHGTLVLTSGRTVVGTLVLGGATGSEGVTVRPDGHGGTMIVAAPDSYTIGGTQALQPTTDAAAIDPFSGVTISDPDVAAIGTATVVLSTAANGSLSDLGGGMLSADGATYAVSGTSDAIQAALRGLAFTPVAHEAAPGRAITTGFSLTVSDGAASASDDKTSVVATAAGATTGTATGDVHLVTLNGLHYDFQADGDFTLERSTEAGNPFDIQIRTAPWAPNHLASVTTEIAAQVGRHVIDFTLGGAITIDGIRDTALTAAHPRQELGGGTLAQLGAGEYQLDWDGQEGLTVNNEGRNFDLHTTVRASVQPGSLQGLLGTLDGPANDLAFPDGVVLPQPIADSTLLGGFANAWRVGAGQSMLDGAVHPQPDSHDDLILDAAPGEILTGSLGAEGAGTVIRGGLDSFEGDAITNFAGKDVIDVTDIASAHATLLNGGGSELTIADGSRSANLTFSSLPALAAFHQASDLHGGTLLWV